jgi:drug/metabolite transporter (DMT)-like permease
MIATMSLVAISLVVLAAFIHAGWNLLAKRRQDILTFYWLFTVAALILYAIPFAILVQRHPPTRDGLPFVLVSSLTHVAYGIFLAKSYSRTDFSVAYPVARGTGVLLIPLAAVPIFGEHPSAFAWLGIGLIVAGVVWLHLPGFQRALKHGGFCEIISLPPILTGISIATYSLNDSAGVDRINPFVYLYLTFVLIAIWFAPYILVYRRPAVVAELRQVWPMLGAGLAVFGAYAIVLAALRLAPVSYVAPMREISIVIGSILGIRLLKEPFGNIRIAACVLVTIGVITIGVAG